MASAEVGTAYVSIMPKMDKGFSSVVTSSLESAGTEGGNMFSQGMLSSFSGMAAKIVAALGLAEVAQKIGEVGKQALDAYASYEQLSGGVSKLFDGAADTVEQNASRAFETAGMSANEYMETVTGFSASLIQSVGGDTAKAAEQADKAIRDMSDNANTFGTDIGSIQNAYQGFAKGNFTMLDNLKLGYGGTKEEMQRLLDDAEALSGVHYDIDNYNDIIEALHTIQEEQHIAGTTANEAAGTVEGSTNAMKASWKNWLTELGKDNADMDAVTEQLVQSVTTAASNAMKVLGRIVKNAVKAFPGLIKGFYNAVKKALPGWLDALKNALSRAWDAIKATATQAWENVKKAISDKWEAIKKTVSEKVDALKAALSAKWDAIKSAISGKVDAIKGALTAAWDNIKSTATTKWEGVKSAISAKWDSIKSAVSSKLDAIKSAISSGWDNIKSAASTAWENIKTTISDKINGAKSAVSSKLGEMRSAITGFRPSFPKIAAPVIGSITGILSDMWSRITSFRPRFPSISAPSIGSITGILSDMWNRITSFRPSFPQISWPTPSLPHIPTPHFSVSWNSILGGLVKIPHVSFNGWWRTGGIFDQPSVIGVGEAGPEMVLPQQGRMMGKFADEIANRMGGISGVTVTGNTFVVRNDRDIPAIARAINRDAERQRRAAL